MAKYGLGCQAQVFQTILERGRCSAHSTAFHLSGELWNTSPTYRCCDETHVRLRCSHTALHGGGNRPHCSHSVVATWPDISCSRWRLGHTPCTPQQHCSHTARTRPRPAPYNLTYNLHICTVLMCYFPYFL